MKIGVENSLGNVKQYLENNNEQVSWLSESDKDSKNALKKYDVIVASGQDSNFLGIQDTSSKSPVINAEGKTAEEIYSEIKNRVR